MRPIALVPLLLLVSSPLSYAGQNLGRSLPSPSVLAQTSITDPDQLFETGVRLYEAGQLKPALENLKQAEAAYRAASNRPKLADTLSRLGLVTEALGQTAQAMDLQQQALTLYRELGDRQGEGASLSNIASLYTRTGETDKALALYQQALPLLRATLDQDGEAATLSAMGRLYRNLGQYDRALELYQQALTIQRAINDRIGEGTTLNNIGLVYHSRSQYTKAEEFYQQSLVLRRAVKDQRGEALTLSNLGTLYSEQGQYAPALKLLEQALQIRRALGDRPGEGTTLNSIAVLYEDLGQPKRAEEFHLLALKIRREVGDRQGEGTTLNNLGRLYANQNQLDKALEYYLQALESRRAVKNRAGEGTVLNNIGEVYRQKGNAKRALEYFQQALTIRRDLGNQTGVAITLNNMAATYLDLKQPDQAQTTYQQSLKILQDIGDRPNQAKVLSNLASIQIQQNRYAQAEAYLYQAIDLLESLRPGLSDANRVSVFENQKPKYRLLEQVLAEQNKAEAALVVSERGRARAFVELLARRTAQQNEATQPVVDLKPITIQEIRQVAQAQQATLVEYSLVNVQDDRGRTAGSKKELLIWVMRPNGQLTLRRVPLENIDLPGLVKIARQSIGVRGFVFVENVGLTANTGNNAAPIQTEQLQQLHQLLIQPIADLLPTQETEKVIFIPQEYLFGTPFAALQDAQGRYLIEKHTIVTAPAIQVLQLTHQINTSGASINSLKADQILVVGNPTMPSIRFRPNQPLQQLAALPGAEKEAQGIAQALGTRAIIGPDATETLVRSQLSQAKLIHLATHGLLDDLDQSGVPGAIALAPTGPRSAEDGLLTSNELLNLKIVANLVVLSACDTGRGVVTGDSVIGLSRSLITAGVPSLVVSLWQVPDAPTAFLMQEFYRNLRQQDKAQALRQAMLRTKQDYPNPRDWAAFTLIGEAN